MRLGRLLLALGVPLLLSACATLPILPPHPPPPEEIFQEVAARQQALQGLKGLAEVKVSSEGKSLRSQQVLFARRPGFLRVESLSPLGTPLLYVVTDGKTLRLYHPGENRYYRGSYRGSSPSLGLPPDLTPQEVVAFLLGGLPPGEYEKASSRADRKEGLWVLDLLSPSRGESRVLWVHPEHFSIIRAEFNSSRFSYRVSFADFRQTNGTLFPRQMVLTSADPPARISVEFQDLELNPPHWQAQDFLLPVPRGAEVYQIP